MPDDIIMIVYDPPKAGLPFLAVAIFPDGEAIATPYPTAAEAQRHVLENAAIALKNRPR